jgi:hypothetical protein
VRETGEVPGREAAAVCARKMRLSGQVGLPLLV